MPDRPYVQGYRSRGIWGAIENPVRISSWEFYCVEDDGEHIYSLEGVSSESEAKRIASIRYGFRESDIGVKIV
jgi:hypothetical protein